MVKVLTVGAGRHSALARDVISTSRNPVTMAAIRIIRHA